MKCSMDCAGSGDTGFTRSSANLDWIVWFLRQLGYSSRNNSSIMWAEFFSKKYTLHIRNNVVHYYRLNGKRMDRVLEFAAMYTENCNLKE